MAQADPTMSPERVAEIRQRLHELGQRTTMPRIMLLCILESANSPMSTAEVYESAQLTVNDRSTIARVLRDLEEWGLCYRLKEDGVVRYMASKCKLRQ